VLLFLAVVALGGATMAKETKAPDPTAAELLALEKRFADALVAADVEALMRLTAEEWVVIGPDGNLTTRAAFLDVVKSGALLHSKMDYDEVLARVYGDTGVVTTRVVTAGSYRGQPFSTTERSTDIFVREHGLWKCVLTQLTTIAEK
jgi:ketosteroid isomerase-like protein